MRKSGGFRFPTSANPQFGEMRNGFVRGNDPDYLYYNAQIINNSTATASKTYDPEILYQDTRSVPILQDKSNYAVSVENFTLNGAGKNLPILIPQIREYNSDGSLNRNPNNTIYDLVFTAQYGGTKTAPELVYQSTRSIQWIPENQATWIEKPAEIGVYQYPQQEIEYYYCYSYSHWVKLVNSALALAWADVKAAALAGGVPGLTIVINSLNGTFTTGGLVQNLETGATGYVVDFKEGTNTLILYNLTGDFNPGDTIFQEPDIGSASISTASFSQNVDVPAVELGTKCPFFTYDPKTNLFSLWQDANTCVTPFGSAVSQPPFDPSNPPNAQNVFGSSISTGYVAGEYSFVGYNTNFESLFTNFNSNYYSDQVPYPSRGALGVAITSPLGTETVDQATAVNVDDAKITDFSGNQMSVSWIGPVVSVGASNWIFGSPLLSVTGLATPLTVGASYVVNGSLFASYLKPGVFVDLTSAVSSSINAVGQIISVVGNNPITSLTLRIKSCTTNASATSWKLTTVTVNSETDAVPVSGQVISLVTDLYPGQSEIQVNHAVTVSGPGGQSFDGLVSSYEETLNYTTPSGGSNEFLVYKDATLPNGFNPIVPFVAQNGRFEIGDIVKGTTSTATAQVIDILAENSGDPNVVTIINQTGSFQVGDTLNVGSGLVKGTGIITKIEGPNSANSILRTGILSISPSFTSGGNNFYSGPFYVGDKVQILGSPANSAIISAISGDNGFTKIDYQQQKNPYRNGAIVQCFASLADPGGPGNPSLCSGTIVDIEGDNKGWGTMNFTNQNCKFGVGETIVDNTTGAVATIVQIQGDNNGYAYISYINQLLTGALGNFVPNEFLLLNGIAFAKVVVDNQSVANNTEGNIGIVTCISGEEIGGVFYANSNVPLPFTGQQIQGSESGTIADFGGVAYKDTGVLILNNICGTFYVGDLIVDSVGYGLKSSQAISQATAICNGMAYLGGGTLTLKNTQGIQGALATFPAGSFLIDFASAGTSNPLVVEVQGIPSGQVFYQGNSVAVAGGFSATVVANNGPTPYGNPDQGTQLLTLLPNTGTWSSALVGQSLSDSTPGNYLNLVLNSTFGSFYPGDQIIFSGSSAATAQITDITPNPLDLPTSFQVENVVSPPFGPGTVYNTTSTIELGASLLYWNGRGTYGDIEIIQRVPLPGDEVYNWDKDVTTNCLYSHETINCSYTNSALVVGDVVKGTKSQVYAIVGALLQTANPPQIVVYSYNGRFVDGEQLQVLSNPPASNTNTVGNIYTVGRQPPADIDRIQLAQCNPVVAFGAFDSLGVLPFIDDDSPSWRTTDIVCSGACFELKSNRSSFVAGSTIYIYNGTTNWNARGTIISIDGLTVKVAFKSFEGPGGGTRGFSINNACSQQAVQPSNADEIGTIKFFTNGVFSATVNNNYRSTAVISSVSSTPTTAGTIVSVASSPSNAFIQTFVPPQTTTALTVTNIVGTFADDQIVQDVQTGNAGKIRIYSETTDYSGTLTTLNVKNVTNSGFFIGGIPITDVQANKTANIGSVAFQNGSLMLKPTNNISFQSGEFVTDLGTLATATLTSTLVPQTILGLTSDAQALVLTDSNSQLKLGSITGTFQPGEEIQSTAGTVAEIEDTSYFGIGNTVTTPTGQAKIVSDDGTKLVINNVSGIFSRLQLVTSTYEGVTSTARITSVTDPTLIIVPTNSTGQSGSWTIVPQALTSSTTLTPPVGGPFTTNLSFDETIYDVGDELRVVETTPALTIEQLYYPENVVQVDLSAGNYTVETLQSLFPSATSGTQYVVLVQDYQSTSSLWSPVASIVIGTQFITVREEYSGTPITIGTGNLGSNATTGSFQKVLLETPIEVLPQESWRGLIVYEQKIEKLSSLGLSKEDLKNLDVQLYWRNRLTNSLTPLTLYNGGSANIRLLFKRIHDVQS